MYITVKVVLKLFEPYYALRSWAIAAHTGVQRHVTPSSAPDTRGVHASQETRTGIRIARQELLRPCSVLCTLQFQAIDSPFKHGILLPANLYS